MNSLDPTQEKALSDVLKLSEPEYNIGGVAGSGKSFLLVALAAALKETEFSFAIAAPTNKAAQVIRSRDLAATTIHKLIYVPYQKYIGEKNGKPVYKLAFRHILEAKDDVEVPDIVMIDEASMVGGRMRADLEALRKINPKVVFIYFGDPFQLPPVNDEAVFHNAKKTAVLTEIHRTAADNPVLAFSKFLRETPSPEAHYPLVGLFERRHVTKEPLPDNAQIICWTNRLRHTLNKRYRTENLQIPSDIETPTAGERIISLDNIYDKGIFNGTICLVASVEDPGPFELYVNLQITPEGNGENVEVEAWKHPFGGNEPPEGVPLRDYPSRYRFDFAHAITAHKSQGSEWPRVAVVDERFKMRHLKGDTDAMAQQWFYTAITRTREELILLRYR